MRLGILRALFYYPFYPFWHAFFRALGFELVLSPPMTSEVFDQVDRCFVGDICLPIEAAFAHAELIKNDVDFIFVPRANRLHEDVYACPACAGLPYLIANIVPDGASVLAINLTPFMFPDRFDLRKLKKAFGFGRMTVTRAFRHAQQRYADFVEKAREMPFLDQAIEHATESVRVRPAPASARAPRILLLGMPYVLGDPFINQGVPVVLAQRKCSVITPFMIAPEYANRELDIEGYCVYWTFGGMSLAAMANLISRAAVDGVIYCSSFACGVDSMILPVVQSACIRCYDIPFTHLILDEHSEASYLEVRIEAFLDCLGPKRDMREAVL